MISLRHREQTGKLIAGYLLLFCANGCFFTWSIFSLAFSQAFPQWTQAQLAFCSALNLIASALSALLVRPLARRVPIPRLCRLGGVIMLAGWISLYTLQWHSNLLVFYAGYCLTGYATGHFYLLTGQVLNTWFASHSGTVSGGMQLVTGFGALVFGALEQAAIAALDVFRLCLFLGVGFFLLSWVCAHWYQLPAEAAAQEKTSAGLSAVKAEMGHVGFWMLFAWLSLLAAGGLLAVNNAANIFSVYRAPAAAGMLVALCSGVACQAVGVVIDRFSLRAAMLMVSLMTVLAAGVLVTGHLGNSGAAVLTGTLLCGGAYGGTCGVKMAGIVKRYGTSRLTAFFGVFNLNIVVASAMGPYAAGRLLMAGEGYFLPFVWIGVQACVSLLTVGLGWNYLKEAGTAPRHKTHLPGRPCVGHSRCG